MLAAALPTVNSAVFCSNSQYSALLQPANRKSRAETTGNGARKCCGQGGADAKRGREKAVRSRGERNHSQGRALTGCRRRAWRPGQERPPICGQGGQSWWRSAEPLPSSLPLPRSRSRSRSLPQSLPVAAPDGDSGAPKWKAGDKIWQLDGDPAGPGTVRAVLAL